MLYAIKLFNNALFLTLSISLVFSNLNYNNFISPINQLLTKIVFLVIFKKISNKINEIQDNNIFDNNSFLFMIYYWN
jgi:hypothetical protein